MVAYSFQPMFVEPTWSGRKVHTIRNERTGRSRHARSGEALQHYTGMRTKHCKLFARSVCKDVKPIVIDFSEMYPGDFVRIDDGPRIWQGDLDPFAISDGFDSWLSLKGFWQKHHPNVLRFQGVIIYWRDMEPVR